MTGFRRVLLVAGVGAVGMVHAALGQARPETNYADLNLGTLTAGQGVPSKDKDAWPQFRGPQRDGIAHSAKGLYRSWPAGGPRVLWSIQGLGVGYSGPAIHAGRVYFHDYDEQKKQWMVRCVSLGDGKEIWRWAYDRLIRPNHGITRTVPAVDDKYVVSLDPKCVLHCFDAGSGRRLWAKDLVKEYGAVIPQWYNGQCPLNEPDRVVIGIGGRQVLMAAFEKATGKAIWQTPNADRVQMAHSSVMPMTLAGRKQYVWATLEGIIGVDAGDGRLLWRGPADDAGKFAWQANTAVAPSAVGVGQDRVFMTSSYKSGSVLFTVAPLPASREGALVARSLFTLGFEQFASDCHTPILWKDHLFAVSNERFTCLNLAGKVVWTSPDGVKFGLGGFVLADGLFFILEGDTGRLRVAEASTEGWKELASAQMLGGHDVWAPMAIANGKLILRDLGKMLCIEVGPAGE